MDTDDPKCTKCGVEFILFSGDKGICQNPDCGELTQEEESKLARLKLKMLARQVTSNDHFEAILMQANPALRRGVYDEIAPLLRFKPKAWTAMKFNRRNRRKKKNDRQGV